MTRRLLFVLLLALAVLPARAQNTLAGNLVVQQSVRFSGDISDTLAADANDYAPANLATAAVLRVTATGAPRTITGLTGGADGRVLWIVNAGSLNVVLADESASSTAANRFALTGALTLPPDAAVQVLYDATSSRWRVAGDAPAWAVITGKPTTLAGYGITDAQPLDADLTSWAALVRSAGFDIFTVTPSSANFASLLTDETGSGGGFVRATSPTLTTPNIGAASGTSLNLTGDLTLGGSITDTGPLNLNAGGTNQNIALVPSGTGSVTLGTAGATTNTLTFANGSALLDTGNSGLIIRRQGGAANASVIIADTTLNAGGRLSTAGSNTLLFQNHTGATEYGRFVSNGNLLLGTTTDNGERLQVNGTALFGNTGNVASRVAINAASDTVPVIGLGAANFGWGFLERLTEGDLVLNRRVSGVASDVMRFTRATGAVTLSGNLNLTGADYGTTAAGQFTVTTNGSATGLAHQVASGSTAGLRLGQTGVTNWNIQNIATTGTLDFGNTTARVRMTTNGLDVLTTTASTSTTSGSATFAGGVGVAGRTSTATLNVGGTNGTTIDLIASATATLDFGSIAAGAEATLTITVTGASTGDSVSLGLPAAPTAGIIFQGFVSASNTVTVRATNITGSPVDPASATYRATVMSF